MAVILRARKNRVGPFVRVFSSAGWKVRNRTNTGWIQMTPTNTRVRNESNSAWLEVK
jgi:hypothetical protein